MNLSRDSLLLYAITDRSFLNGETLPSQVEKAILGGATFIQLREKNITKEEYIAHALDIKKITDKYNVPFVINDNVHIAKKVNAHGAHLGQNDMPASEARKYLGNEKIIGVTVKTPEQAKEAEKNGADYLGAGAVFSTKTKSDTKPLPLNILKDIVCCVNIPVIAIGGINEDNILELKNTGIYGVAVVSGIFSRQNITAAAETLYKLSYRLVKE